MRVEKQQHHDDQPHHDFRHPPQRRILLLITGIAMWLKLGKTQRGLFVAFLTSG